MSTNPIEKNPTPKPTGTLEELFRHHLGEEATVPPRPMLWDQIDNSLLIQQNEIYRKRLAATRWVAAASLLLATLAGAGWWAQRDTSLGAAAELAQVRQAVEARAATGRSARTSAAQPLVAANAANTTEQAATPLASSLELASAPDASATPARGPLRAATSRGTTGRLALATYGTKFNAPGGEYAGVAALRGPARQELAAARMATRSDAGLGAARAAVAAATPIGVAAAASAPLGGVAGSALAPITSLVTSGVSAVSDAGSAPVVAANRESVTANVGSVDADPSGSVLADGAVGPAEALDTRFAGLQTASLAALPTGLPAPELPATNEPAVASARRWNYGARYTAASFNPNINFSRTGTESEFGYNPALGSGSPALTEAAATEYRDNLRPGLSLRLAVLASRHLRGHWLLSTGVELSQATARSTSSAAFVGEQLLDVGQTDAGPMRATNFRYRLAGVPVEVRYANPLKRGLSFYGRLGGAVSALLGVRSEAEGYPEATRTYSLLSAGTPYRRVLTNVHGGAGAQFRPNSGNWTLTLGPVAEMGLFSLNAYPAQGYLAQSRPYSVGIEAGVEFGR